jgi:hypothetical protein
LNALPHRDGYANRTTDGWNRSLRYVIDPNGTFVLSSLGRDGKPGGSGDDADVSARFRIVNGEASRVP